MGPFNSRVPGTVGAARPSDADVVNRLRSGLSWLDVQPAVVKLVGPLSFSAGVVVGMGEDIVSSVVELADLVKTFVLADLYDRAWGGAANGAGFSLTDPIRMLVVAVGGAWLREEAREARDQRDALIEALREAFNNPGEFFGAIKDEYVEKWEKFERLNAQTSISARFEAGRLFGEILLAVLGLLAGGAGLAKLGAKLGGKFAKLGRKLEKAAAGLKRRKGRGEKKIERGEAKENRPTAKQLESAQKKEPPGDRPKARVVTRDEAEKLLVDGGLSPAKAKDFVSSFDGPITAREVETGEKFLRYTDVADSKGSFFTKSAFESQEAAAQALYLKPYGNNASLVQEVIATKSTTVLEGAVAEGVPPGTVQTLLTDRTGFAIGKGVAYP